MESTELQLLHVCHLQSVCYSCTMTPLDSDNVEETMVLPNNMMIKWSITNVVLQCLSHQLYKPVLPLPVYTCNGPAVEETPSPCTTGRPVHLLMCPLSQLHHCHTISLVWTPTLLTRSLFLLETVWDLPTALK